MAVAALHDESPSGCFARVFILGSGQFEIRGEILEIVTARLELSVFGW